MGSVPLQWRTLFYVSLQCVLSLQPPYLDVKTTQTQKTEKPEISAFAYREKERERDRESRVRGYEMYAHCHTHTHIYRRVRLICALRAHIKFSIFRNIFSEIEKAVITFSIFEKIFSKNKN